MDTVTHTLDARGLNCPLPILRARKALGGLGAGEMLELIATDPGSVKDIEAFCKQTGNELITTDDRGGDFRFVIRKA